MNHPSKRWRWRHTVCKPARPKPCSRGSLSAPRAPPRRHRDHSRLPYGLMGTVRTPSACRDDDTVIICKVVHIGGQNENTKKQSLNQIALKQGLLIIGFILYNKIWVETFQLSLFFPLSCLVSIAA